MPEEQSYPTSTAQVESHPSPLIKLPSSQYPVAGTTTTPSPHISVQELGVMESPSVHDQLGSTAQFASHPSPGRMLPSSQYPAFGIATIPSPHVSVQTVAPPVPPPVQLAPPSIVQVEEHPSPFIKFPSSQASVLPLAINPFPQVSK